MTKNTDKTEVDEQDLLDQEKASFIYDIREKRLEVFEMYQDIMIICKALVADAKVNPKTVNAAQLAQILRFLGQARKVLDEAEQVKEQIDEQLTREQDEEGMTEEEKEMVRQFEESTQGFEAESIYHNEDEKPNKIHTPFKSGF